MMISYSGKYFEYTSSFRTTNISEFTFFQDSVSPQHNNNSNNCNINSNCYSISNSNSNNNNNNNNNSRLRPLPLNLVGWCASSNNNQHNNSNNNSMRVVITIIIIYIFIHGKLFSNYFRIIKRISSFRYSDLNTQDAAIL